MKKANFDLGAAALLGVSPHDVQAAHGVMERNQHLLQATGVVGVWIGARAHRPYIMLAVNEQHSDELRERIPDALDGINAYYIEGALGDGDE